MIRGYYAPRGGYGPLRDSRGYYNRYYQTQGPSPWIPATLLGVIMLITVMPYMRTPDATLAYYTAVRPYSRFPGGVLWILVLGVIALQFFGGSWYHGYYGQPYYGRHGMHRRAPGMFGYPSGAFGGVIDHRAPWGASSWWPWSSSSSSSLWNPYNRYYNIHQQRGVMSTFMDYGGHWLLIFLGLAVFSLVSTSSVSSAPVSLALHRRRWFF